MNQQQVAELSPQLRTFLKGFRQCFAAANGFEHLGICGRGLMSDLARKSVEPVEPDLPPTKQHPGQGRLAALARPRDQVHLPSAESQLRDRLCQRAVLHW